MTYFLTASGNSAYAPMHYVIPQKHSDFEIVYYREAEGVTTINQETYEISSDCLAVIPPNVEHDELLYWSNRVLYCRFSSSDGSVPLSNCLFWGRNGRSEDIFGILNRIMEESFGQLSRYQEYVDLLVKQLLLEIDRASGKRKHLDVVARIMEYIQNAYGQDIDFERLSESYGYSLSRVRHIFKQEKNISLYQYLINVRMNEAKRYLKSTTLSVQEIARRCGYKESNFVTMFSRRFGITPHQYRMRLSPGKEGQDVVVFSKDSEKP